MKVLYLKKGKEQSLYRFHQWVFSGALQAHDPIDNGELVKIYTFDNQFVAWGFYNYGSIAVKVLGFKFPDNPALDIQLKIEQAYQVRKRLGLVNNPYTNCFRLIHGEGDGLPGLVADVYDKHVVLQIHHVGMENFLPVIEASLLQLDGLTVETLAIKYVETKEKTKGIKFLKGSATETIVKENDYLFYVDWYKGQKTGFFIDQRENRNLLKQYVWKKKVLNTFCYTGGFSIYAEKGGASEVYSIDYSAWAMEEVKRNYQLNGLDISSERLICGNALEYLQHEGENYDVIILDPPAFAKSIQSRHQAIQAYKRINKSAIKNIKQGGIIFTFSCSQVVDAHMFRQTVYSAGIEVGRTVRILHQLGQPADHPVNLFHPETEYLKGLVLMVE